VKAIHRDTQDHVFRHLTGLEQARDVNDQPNALLRLDLQSPLSCPPKFLSSPLLEKNEVGHCHIVTASKTKTQAGSTTLGTSP
jgi:hypothetical protein